MSRFGHRDQLAGALMALIGAAAIHEGLHYGVGTLTNMGSGFFPVAIGAGLILLGIAMAAANLAEAHAVAAPDWRGALAIAAGVVSFIALADRAGLAPATFACVFVAALGARGTRAVEAALLAAGVTVFGILLFSYGLKVQFPILRGLTQ